MRKTYTILIAVLSVALSCHSAPTPADGFPVRPADIDRIKKLLGKSTPVEKQLLEASARLSVLEQGRLLAAAETVTLWKGKTSKVDAATLAKWRREAQLEPSEIQSMDRWSVEMRNDYRTMIGGLQHMWSFWSNPDVSLSDDMFDGIGIVRFGRRRWGLASPELRQDIAKTIAGLDDNTLTTWALAPQRGERWRFTALITTPTLRRIMIQGAIVSETYATTFPLDPLVEQTLTGNFPDPEPPKELVPIFRQLDELEASDASTSAQAEKLLKALDAWLEANPKHEWHDAVTAERIVLQVRMLRIQKREEREKIEGDQARDDGPIGLPGDLAAILMAEAAFQNFEQAGAGEAYRGAISSYKKWITEHPKSELLPAVQERIADLLRHLSLIEGEGPGWHPLEDERKEFVKQLRSREKVRLNVSPHFLDPDQLFEDIHRIQSATPYSWERIDWVRSLPGFVLLKDYDHDAGWYQVEYNPRISRYLSDSEKQWLWNRHLGMTNSLLRGTCDTIIYYHDKHNHVLDRAARECSDLEYLALPARHTLEKRTTWLEWFDEHIPSSQRETRCALHRSASP